jgi:hypothetical protein
MKKIGGREVSVTESDSAIMMSNFVMKAIGDMLVGKKKNGDNGVDNQQPH